MIIAKNLTKRYGKIAALNNITFTIKTVKQSPYGVRMGRGKPLLSVVCWVFKALKVS